MNSHYENLVCGALVSSVDSQFSVMGRKSHKEQQCGKTFESMDSFSAMHEFTYTQDSQNPQEDTCALDISYV